MTEAYTIQQLVGDALEVVSSSSDQSLVIEKIGPLAQRAAADPGW